MPTTEQLQAGKQIVLAVAETIREAGETPSGTLYAVLCGRVSLNGFQKIITILVNAGLVRESAGHMLTWIGPKVSA